MIQQTRDQNKNGWIKIQKVMEQKGQFDSHEEGVIHWKVDKSTDYFGRRQRMKPNRHFDIHEEASKLRDSGNTPPETIEPKPFVLADSFKESNKISYFHADCQLLTIPNIFKGSVHIYKDSIMFQSTEANSLFQTDPQTKSKIFEIDATEMSFCLTRRYVHEDNGAEIFTKDGKSYFFVLLI